MAWFGLVWYGLNFGIVYSKMFPGEVGRMSRNFFISNGPKERNSILYKVFFTYVSAKVLDSAAPGSFSSSSFLSSFSVSANESGLFQNQEIN